MDVSSEDGFDTLWRKTNSSGKERFYVDYKGPMYNRRNYGRVENVESQ